MAQANPVCINESSEVIAIYSRSLVFMVREKQYLQIRKSCFLLVKSLKHCYRENFCFDVMTSGRFSFFTDRVLLLKFPHQQFYRDWSFVEILEINQKFS